MNELPLSWARQSKEQINSLNLPKSNLLYNCDLQEGTSVAEVIEEQMLSNSGSVLLRGVLPSLAATLQAQLGGKILPLGAAGHLEPRSYLPSKSVSNLARRASRTVSVRGVSPIVAQKISSQLLLNSKYASTPKLRYLFRTNALECQHAVAAFKLGSPSQPLALLTLTEREQGCWHIEQMLRDCSAPVGTMEFLLLQLVLELAERDQRTLSLGEAPFLEVPSGSHIEETKTRAVFRASMLSSCLLRPSFEANSLYDFKQKFALTWQPVYWYSTGSFSFRDFNALFKETGCRSIALKNQIKRLRPARWQAAIQSTP